MMIKQKYIKKVRSETAACLKKAKLAKRNREIYLRALEAIERRLDLNEVILPELIAKDIGISMHLYDVASDDYPKLYLLIFNCRQRRVVESFSIVPELLACQLVEGP